jgi:regulatory protein
VGVSPTNSRHARAFALDCLARHDRSAAELTAKLQEKGYDREICAQVVADLVREHLVDDRRYVEQVLTYRAARGQGPNKIRYELEKKGLDKALVADSITAFGDWNAAALRAREKKFGASLPTLYADKARQSRFLAYRGFTGAQIRLVLGFDEEI